MSREIHSNICRLTYYAIVTLTFLSGPFVVYGCRKETTARPVPKEKVQELQSRLVMERSKYAMGTPIVVSKYIKNNSDKDILICAWPSGEEKLFTFYMDGRPILKKDIVSFYKPVSKDKSFITIKAGAEIKFTTMEFAEKWESMYFDKAGKWDLKLISFFDYTGEAFGLNGWRGTLHSNTVTVMIEGGE